MCKNSHMPNGQDCATKMHSPALPNECPPHLIALRHDTILGSAARYFAEELNPLLNTVWLGNRWSLGCDTHRLGRFPYWFDLWLATGLTP